MEEQSNCRYVLYGFPFIHDWEEIEFDSKLPDNLICSVCGVVPSETRILQCSHVLCGFCFKSVTAGGDDNICPIDGKSFENSQCDRSAIECLRNYSVPCWNKLQGCSYKGPLKTLQHHYDWCYFRTRACPSCGLIVKWADMVQHRQDKCAIKDWQLTNGDEPIPTSQTRDQSKIAVELGELKLTVNELTSKLTDVTNKVNVNRDYIELLFDKMENVYISEVENKTEHVFRYLAGSTREGGGGRSNSSHSTSRPASQATSFKSCDAYTGNDHLRVIALWNVPLLNLCQGEYNYFFFTVKENNIRIILETIVSKAGLENVHLHVSLLTPEEETGRALAWLRTMKTNLVVEHYMSDEASIMFPLEVVSTFLMRKSKTYARDVCCYKITNRHTLGSYIMLTDSRNGYIRGNSVYVRFTGRSK